MKKGYIYSLLAVGLCVCISVLISGGWNEMFLIVMGAVFVLASPVALFGGVVSSNAENRKALFITSGILLLIGAGICGPMMFGAFI